MEQINIHKAKTQLSRLISEGKEVVITRYGRPVAKLVLIKHLAQDRKPGTAKGKIRMNETFFDPLPDDVLNEFYK